jgi:hypothetical protein
MKMKTGNRSKSASSASVRSDKALAREEALSESKDLEHHLEELSLEYSEVNNNIRDSNNLRVSQLRTCSIRKVTSWADRPAKL